MPNERQPVPVPGERVFYRAEQFGEKVIAVVAEVQDMETPGDHWGPPAGTGNPDPNVWEYDEDSRAWRLKDDPWPWVSVRVVTIVPGQGEVLGEPRWCKEARVRGAPGWLRGNSPWA